MDMSVVRLKCTRLIYHLVLALMQFGRLYALKHLPVLRVARKILLVDDLISLPVGLFNV